jgi:polyisoprenyl-phosphate glycosyltransferase
MVTNSDGGPHHGLVVPVYNEEAVLPNLLRRPEIVMQRLDGPAGAIFVDDGGSDCSSIILGADAKDDSRVDAPVAS